MTRFYCLFRDISQINVSIKFCCIYLQAKPHDTLDLCGLLNDNLAQTARSHPKRFVGLGTLPMQAPDLAILEMRRCVKELGFPGVQIGSHINNWDLNAPELLPFYAVRHRPARTNTTSSNCSSPVFCLGWLMMFRTCCPLKTRPAESVCVFHLGCRGAWLLHIRPPVGYADRWEDG